MLDSEHNINNSEILKSDKKILLTSDIYLKKEIDIYKEKSKKRVKKKKSEIPSENISSKIKNDKIIRCRTFGAGLYDAVPESFKVNTTKEKLIFDHAEKFKTQFNIIYDQRELFICPYNECDIQKFICTTVKPTKMGYTELYNYEDCAKFISNFVTYELLEVPNEYPKYLPSPSNVIKWQKGDCFDVSILLACLLLGVDYDAYCVIGTAEKEITEKIESNLDNPFIQELENIKKEKKNANNKKEEVINEYYTKKIQIGNSKHYDYKDKDIEKMKISKFIEVKKEDIESSEPDDDEPDRDYEDPYLNQRLHCWILIKKGKRNIKENLFIEPSTGRIYPISDDIPYLKINQIFNHKNFWINVNYDNKITDINFENMSLGDQKEFEYVILDDLKFNIDNKEEDENISENKSNDNSEYEFNNEDEKKIKEITQILDMPSSWVPKLFISKDRFLMGTPNGETTRFFKKSKIDIYAEFSQCDGMVKKITEYNDYKRTIVNKITVIYSSRKDNLTKRVRYPFEFKTVSYYKPNNNPYTIDDDWPHWRKIEEIQGRSRITKYYNLRNNDGLYMRVELIGKKTSEYFRNRDDKLIYRSVSYAPLLSSENKLDFMSYEDNNIGLVKVQKMVQKFEKVISRPINEQIEKVNIDLISNKIKINFHLEANEIAPISVTHSREKISGLTNITEERKKGENAEEQKLYHKIYLLEKDCFSGIKVSEELYRKDLNEHKTKIENKILECKTITEEHIYKEKIFDILEKSLMQKAEERNENNQKRKEEELAEVENENDPFAFAFKAFGVSNKDVLDINKAISIKNFILKKVQKRLINRAEIINQRIEDEKKNLINLESEYNKAKENKNKYENYEELISDLNFRISILEQRSTNFEMNAIKKYKDMQEAINSDYRFASLKNNKE